MSRYYFDICNDHDLYRDEFGDDFDGVDDVRQQAQAILSDLLREKLLDGEEVAITCDVRDESGHVIYEGKIHYQGTQFARVLKHAES